MRETARLVATLEGARVAGSLPASVDAVACDSREVRPGTMFVALHGERADGHDFVRDAVARGASVVVVDCDVRRRGLTEFTASQAQFEQYRAELEHNLGQGQG